MGHCSPFLHAAFGFASLPKDATLVGGGGRAGAVSLKIAEAAPQIKIVFQDRPEVINGEAKSASGC